MAERLPAEHGAYDFNEAKQAHAPNGVEPHVAAYSSMNGKVHQARNELLNAPSPNSGRSPHLNGGISNQHKLLGNISENSEGSTHSLRITSPHGSDRPHRRAHSNSDEMLSASSRGDDNVSIDARSLQNGEDSYKPRGTISISSNQVQAEWIEQYEPGVYITLTTLRDGTRDLKRVRFRYLSYFLSFLLSSSKLSFLFSHTNNSWNIDDCNASCLISLWTQSYHPGSL